MFEETQVDTVATEPEVTPEVVEPEVTPEETPTVEEEKAA